MSKCPKCGDCFANIDDRAIYCPRCEDHLRYRKNLTRREGIYRLSNVRKKKKPI